MTRLQSIGKHQIVRTSIVGLLVDLILEPRSPLPFHLYTQTHSPCPCFPSSLTTHSAMVHLPLVMTHYTIMSISLDGWYIGPRWITSIFISWSILIRVLAPYLQSHKKTSERMHLHAHRCRLEEMLGISLPSGIFWMIWNFCKVYKGFQCDSRTDRP